MSQGTILKEMINRAIADGVVTVEEYNQILIQAGADGHEDTEERALLAQLHEMIADGTIERVA